MTIMKYVKGLLVCLLLITLPLNTSAASNSTSFNDVQQDSWSYPYIKFLSERGIITGYPDGTFKPNSPINRLQAATMLTRALSVDTSYYSAPYYEDVNERTYGYPVIATSTDEGWFDFIADENFGAGKVVTRGDMAALLSRSFSLPNHPEYYFQFSFNDVLQRYWAIEHIEALAFNNIVEGYDDGTFRPHNPVTRAQFSKMVYLAMQQSQDTLVMNHNLKDYLEGYLGYSVSNEDLLYLYEIDFMESGVTSLRGIEYARNLETVDLTYSSIYNLMPLKAIPNLNHLTLGDYNIDYKISEQLSQLDQIESLNLTLSSVSDYAFIGKMTNLVEVDLSSTNLTYSEIMRLEGSYPYIHFIY